MITCEHCGSPLPEGAIFCGECGRAVSVGSARRQAPPAASRQDAPPPLQTPEPYGRPRQDPASEAWLPEATLDPATRAWLAGRDRGATGPVAPVPDDRRDGPSLEPRSAPSHVHGSESGIGSWAVGGQRPSGVSGADRAQGDAPVAGGTVPQDPRAAAPAEPSLDPDAFPSEPAPTPLADAFDAPSQRRSARSAEPAGQPGAGWPQYAEPVRPPEPAAPTWWVGRSRSDAAETAADLPSAAHSRPTVPTAGASTPVRTDDVSAPLGVHDDRAPAAADGTGESGRPSAGDTNVVEPLPDRRVPRRPSLVQPGAHASVCHVCGHQLEPDDIFCPECGAVRGAVTAAFTGPIVPLPVERPDWAAAPHDPEAETRTDEDAAAGSGAVGSAAAGSDAAGSDGVGSAEAGNGAAGRDVDGAAGEDGDGPAGEGGEGTAAGRGLPTGTDRDGEGSDWAALDGGHRSAALGADEPGDREDPPQALPDADQAADHRGGDGALTGEVRRGAPPAHRSDDEPVRTDAGAMPPAPGSPTVPSSAPRGSLGVPLGQGPFVAPLPPVTGSSAALPSDPVPSSADADEDASLGEDVENTRIVGRETQQAPFVLHFSTGERVDVRGTGLLGRLPRPAVGEHFDDFVTIRDPGKSVSKTHLEFGRDGDDLWVSDRFSGNGTTVRHIDGSIRSCEPGRRYRVERGARVDIGEQFFLVQ